ncbi:hypothetical protein GIB67_010191 [Kingdonia uniflora]|uniref:Uncharacterized protein n=1 Tax=Kingdonia uniflora TaxID=39325 RepID=A0A7J7NAG2_9MAGN|nr:hypothetical protein GIB67_010191 [Kingdonia uniflora]
MSIRGFGAILHKLSNGVCLKCSNSLPIQRIWYLDRSITSWVTYELNPNVNTKKQQLQQHLRRIWTFSPVCMGRRSCKIAGRKNAQDAKKAKRYGKIGKEIVSAVKKGGPNPVSNSILAVLLEKAKELDVPKEILERNMKRASEKGQEAYIEKMYEVYGFGGAGMVVEVLTDKINRSVAAVREVVKDCGGKMADPGSILFKFRRARVVNVKAKDAEKDQLLEIALDVGAEDVIEPPVYEDDPEEDLSERLDCCCSYYKIVSSSENYPDILAKLREEEIAFEPDNGSELLPLTPIEVLYSFN